MTEVPICKECGKEIPIFGKYAKHEDGTILCKECFDRLIKKGDIE